MNVRVVPGEERDLITEVIKLIDEDLITTEEANNLQSALFQRIGRNIGKAVAEAFAGKSKPKDEKDLGLEDLG